MGYPDQSRNKPNARLQATLERVQAAIGERRQDGTGKEAVTHDDVAGLGTLVFKSAYVTATPTAAQYNALVDDLRALAAVLNAVGASITWTS
jgi:hypothetical protein